MTVIHLMKETLSECTVCESENVKRVPSMMLSKITKKEKVGDKVKDGIKKNQEILDQQIKEFRKDYDG